MLEPSCALGKLTKIAILTPKSNADSRYRVMQRLDCPVRKSFDKIRPVQTKNYKVLKKSNSCAKNS